MGRELKRVPFDFDWPLNEVWLGFINPYYGKCSDDCPECNSTGLTPLARALTDLWYAFDPYDVIRIAKAVPYHPAKKKVISFIREKLNQARMPRCRCWSYNIDQDDVKALWDEGRLYDFKRVSEIMPTAETVNNWAQNSLGHDAINSHCKHEEE